LKLYTEGNSPIQGMEPELNWPHQSNVSEDKRATKKNHKKMNYLLINN